MARKRQFAELRTTIPATVWLAPQNEPMSKQAMTAGFYGAPNGKDQYRKIQIVTVGDLLERKTRTCQ